MPIILGIDAAWTVTEPSGVALVRSEGLGWQCLAVAPSYETFLAFGMGEPIQWDRRSFKASSMDAMSLLDAAQKLAGKPVDLVAVDIPIATIPISCRRRADDAISTEFGSRWCSAHTPNVARPGLMGAALSESFLRAGYPICTAKPQQDGRHLLEVYPHPALLSLLDRPRRVPYKVSKASKYWPDYSIAERIEALLAQYTQILSALVAYFGKIDINLPRSGSVTRLSYLKRYEDALDAIVCAWVGAEHLAGRTLPLGDDTAAIWCPADVVWGSIRTVWGGNNAEPRGRVT